MLKIGYHISVAGGISLAFDRAEGLGCGCMQVFVSNPRGWEIKKLDERDAGSFRSKRKSTGIEPIAHMPYLPNLASPKEDVYAKSKEALAGTLERCNLLGIRYLVMHLGSHLGEGTERGRERVADAINEAAGRRGDVTMLLENEAGQRNSVGSMLEELTAIHGMVDGKGVGFCLDTCHVFAAGYDIRRRDVAKEVADTLGADRILCLHLNDAKYPLGSRLDRHADIGFGHIGRKGFETFFRATGLADKPMIMETPLVETPKDARGELQAVRKMLNDALG